MKKLIFILYALLIYNLTFNIENCSSHWIQQNSGTTNTLNHFHFINSNTGIIVGDNGTILRTTNGGTNWMLNLTDNSIFTSVYFIDDMTGFITGSGNLYKTTNAGLSWKLSFINPNESNNSITFFNNYTGYIFSASYCTFTTTNCGENWTPANIVPNGYSVSAYQCSVKINDTLILIGGCVFVNYVGCCTSFFWATPSHIFGGNAGAANRQVSTIVMAGNSGTGYARDDGYLLKTTNYGVTWFNAPYYMYDPMSFYNDSSGIYLDRQNGYYYLAYTTNRGTNWIIKDSADGISCGSYYLNYGEVIGNNGDIVAIGSNGLIFRKNNDLTINNESITTTKNFKLLQNYPNPFNPSTNIRYEIPKNEFVKLIVFDILGREIETLVNEKKSPGTYEVTFDGSRLASGIYFYTLSAGEFQEIKKLVLLK